MIPRGSPGVPPSPASWRTVAAGARKDTLLGTLCRGGCHGLDRSTWTESGTPSPATATTRSRTPSSLRSPAATCCGTPCRFRVPGGVVAIGLTRLPRATPRSRPPEPAASADPCSSEPVSEHPGSPARLIITNERTARSIPAELSRGILAGTAQPAARDRLRLTSRPTARRHPSLIFMGPGGVLTLCFPRLPRHLVPNTKPVSHLSSAFHRRHRVDFEDLFFGHVAVGARRRHQGAQPSQEPLWAHLGIGGLERLG